MCVLYFFFNDTATTEIYTLSLHDALPIWTGACEDLAYASRKCAKMQVANATTQAATAPHYALPECGGPQDRKSTRLNSSHANISYAVFCLKKKNNKYHRIIIKNYSCYRKF